MTKITTTKRDAQIIAEAANSINENEYSEFGSGNVRHKLQMLVDDHAIPESVRKAAEAELAHMPADNSPVPLVSRGPAEYASHTMS